MEMQKLIIVFELYMTEMLFDVANKVITQTVILGKVIIILKIKLIGALLPTITWTDIDPGFEYHMTLLGHNELMEQLV